MQREPPGRPVPPRVLAISVAALAVPILGQLFFTQGMAEYEFLLWLLALVPAFLLAYHRGWRGVAQAFAIGMAVLATTQVLLLLAGRRFDHWPILMGVVVVYLTVSLAVGWMSELLHRERERAEGLAMLDELTGLPNRRLGRRFLEIEVAAAQRGRQMTLVMMDLDNFKRYNDTYGHVAGDRALAAMGRVLGHNTRRMNLSARWGGEEFIAILSDTDAEGAVMFVHRVRKTLRAASVKGGPLTFSAGVAEYAPGMASTDDLLNAADQAMYEAKTSGRDAVRVYGHSKSLN